MPVPSGEGLRKYDGLLVVGHGTADPAGAAETKAVAAQVAALRPELPVEVGFLEVIQPGIGDAMERLVARGCRRVAVLPLLLFAAGHAKRDVPQALVEAAAATGIELVQAAPLGLHPSIVDLARRRREEAIFACSAVSPAPTAVVMVGRGSSDPSAGKQLASLAEAIAAADLAPVAACLLGFVAAARPTLAEALAEAAREDVRRVVVHPHLLFSGHVETQVVDAVKDVAAVHPDREWILVGRLGADRAVAEALLGRAEEAVRDAGGILGGPNEPTGNISPAAGENATME
jgi:sirohydrochlorin ferrochelatase